MEEYSVVALTQPTFCGVSDYAGNVAQTAAVMGLGVDLRVRPTRIRSFRDVLAANIWLFKDLPVDRVVWNYVSFGGTFRGVPLLAPIFPLYIRMRGRSVTVVAHEMYPPFSTSLRANILSVLHVMAMWTIAAGANETVVTTETRLNDLRSWPGLGRKVRLLPVFSNWPHVNHVVRDVPSRTVAVPGWGHPRIPIGELMKQFKLAKCRVVLVGGPGPESKQANAWREASSAVGLPLSFTGITTGLIASTALSAADVVIIPTADGPTSSKGTLAAALLNGCVIVGLDGPLAWSDLVDSEAVALHDVHNLADAIRDLLESAVQRRQMSAAARAFYVKNLSVEKATMSLFGRTGS